jgi:BMFP domain-containing protein YqiC
MSSRAGEQWDARSWLLGLASPLVGATRYHHYRPAIQPSSVSLPHTPLKAHDMTQTTNRFLDEIARLMNDAAGVASGVRREVDTVVRNQADRILRELDVVKRDEFEAVKDMVRLAREENEALKARIAALEAKIGAAGVA